MEVRDPLPGYQGKIRELLEKQGARIGSRIRIVKKPEVYIEGLLMPKHSFSSPSTIVVKLDNGYNIGVAVDSNTRVEIIEEKVRVRAPEKPIVKQTRKELPRIKIISTGGTIASKVEYETGAVRPALTPEELIELIPELADIAVISADVLFSILSENMTPNHWETIARRVSEAIISENVDGVVIAHGTDTMSYTAAALAFALQRLPVPIILVGAQRSSDRPSTDSALNLIGASIAASRLPIGEVMVCMHATPDDSTLLVHRGVKVRKIHSSRRDAFQSINDRPLALIDPLAKKYKILNPRYIPRTSSAEELIVKAKFDDKVALVKAYPGFQREIIDFLVDRGFHGIVIEGTGLGHIATHTLSSIARAIENGVAVVMTTQTLFGRVNMNVYTTGRELLKVGVIPGEDMLPEVAYVKLSWVLAQTRVPTEVRKMILTNYVNEINPIHTAELYPKWSW
ncbi:MAG: Glu-tRNA(Gln) amidotransferase GatDE subunit D [Thermoprotei archaeon]|nr:MAG: Glu-tRNA(Gln) amidotransferase GatDE subunit D [Thermoprotei archaeon]